MRIPLNELTLLRKCARLSRCQQSELVRHWVQEHHSEHVVNKKAFAPVFDTTARTKRRIWSLRLADSDLDKFKACAQAAKWTQTDLFRYWVCQYWNEHGKQSE